MKIFKYIVFLAHRLLRVQAASVRGPLRGRHHAHVQPPLPRELLHKLHRRGERVPRVLQRKHKGNAIHIIIKK